MAMLILTARTDLTHGYAYCIANDNVKALLISRHRQNAEKRRFFFNYLLNFYH